MSGARFYTLRKSTRAVENWLRTRVGPAYDALQADRSRAVTALGVRKRLAAEHKTACRTPSYSRRKQMGALVTKSDWVMWPFFSKSWFARLGKAGRAGCVCWKLAGVFGCLTRS